MNDQNFQTAMNHYSDALGEPEKIAEPLENTHTTLEQPAELNEHELLARYPGAEKVYILKDDYSDFQHKFIALRSPSAGDLRNLSMSKLIELDSNMCFDFLERIQMNGFTKKHLYKLTAKDLLGLSLEAVSFLAD